MDGKVEDGAPDGRFIVARAVVNIRPQSAFSRAQRILHDRLVARTAVVHQVIEDRAVHLYELREIDAPMRDLLWEFYRTGAAVHLALTRYNERPSLVDVEALKERVAATLENDIFPTLRLRRSELVVFRPKGNEPIEPRIRGSALPSDGAVGTVTRVDAGPRYGVTLAHVVFGGGVGTWIVPENSLRHKG